MATNIKKGQIGKIVFKCTAYGVFYNKTLEKTCVVLEKTIKPIYEKDAIVKEKEIFKIICVGGEQFSVCETEIASFKSTRLSDEVRTALKNVFKQYEKISLEEEKLKKQEEIIRNVKQEFNNCKLTLRQALGIMSENAFLDSIRNAVKTKGDWVIDTSPGPSVCVDQQYALYFYKEIEVRPKYQANYSELTYEEYDGTVFLERDYETMEEFKKYQQQYEEKFLSKLPVYSLCFVGASRRLYYKCYQVINIDCEYLTKDVVEKTISEIQKYL